MDDPEYREHLAEALSDAQRTYLAKMKGNYPQLAKDSRRAVRKLTAELKRLDARIERNKLKAEKNKK